MDDPKNTKRVFVSHAPAEAPLARLIVKALRRHGVRAWAGQRDARGADSTGRAGHALQSAAAYVAVISDDAATQPGLDIEVGAALALGIRVLPVFLNERAKEVSRVPVTGEPILAMATGNTEEIAELVAQAIAPPAPASTKPSHQVSRARSRAEPPEPTRMVGYLGPPWSFHHLAALELFPEATLVSYGTPRALFRALENDLLQQAVLPVANSTTGAITETLQLLAEQPRDAPIRIVEEIYLPIDHNLLARAPGIELRDVDAVLAPQSARDECVLWLEGHLPTVEFVATATTATAAEHLKVWCSTQSREAVAIGPRQLGTHYGLHVIAQHIQDQANNTTHFLALSKLDTGTPRRLKATLAVILQDKPGSLATLLQALASRGFNLLGIKMAPVRAPAFFDWKDWFFLDISLPSRADQLTRSLVELGESSQVLVLKALGTYGDASPTEKDRANTLFRSPTKVFRHFGVAPGLETGMERVIAKGESHSVEFKSTLRLDLRDGKKSPALELEVAKTIAGFMNTEGGLLLIGVADNGEVIGIDAELQTFAKTDTDAYARALMQIVENFLGPDRGPAVHVEFVSDTAGRAVCVVEVKRSSDPVYTRVQDQPKFFVRVGPSTRELNSEDSFRYIDSRRRERGRTTAGRGRA